VRIRAKNILYNFQGPTAGDGAFPVSELLIAQGGLIRTTSLGGRGGGSECFNSSGGNGCGVVFKLVPSQAGWSERILHRFTGRDGANPHSGVVADSAGALYGTTSTGTHSYGTLYRLTPGKDAWVEQTLHAFQDGSPNSSVVNVAGVLYGTTANGGSSPCFCGNVFKWTL
jgi:hypothetical protein